jgi:hypothetical protein
MLGLSFYTKIVGIVPGTFWHGGMVQKGFRE